jgi:hypothetical protein
MGAGGSKTYKTAMTAANKVVNEILQENTTNCVNNSDFQQSIRIVAGDNSTITMTDTKVALQVASRVACLAKIQFSQDQMTSMSNQMAAQIKQITEGIPQIGISEKQKMDISISISNEITNKNVMRTIVNSIQSTLSKQEIVLMAGDNSTIQVKNISLNILADIVNTSTVDALSTIVSRALTDNQVDAAQVMEDKPISAVGGAISGIIDSAGNAAAGILSGLGSIMNSYLMFLAVIIIAVLIVVAMNFKTIKGFLGPILAKTPMGRIFMKIRGKNMPNTPTLTNISTAASNVAAAAATNTVAPAPPAVQHVEIVV